MGHRANLIIVKNGECTLYYSHWCANTLPQDLFWGPDYAVSFIQSQRAMDETGWLDDIWAEGAAVLDCDRQALLFYGGEDVRFDVPLRRIYLQMLRRVWRTWQVQWAYEGIADIADYVGYPRDRVITGRDRYAVKRVALAPPEKMEWTRLIGSFRNVRGDLLFFPLERELDYYLLAGPRLADQSRRALPMSRIPFDKWTPHGFPIGGFHVEIGQRRLEYWHAADEPGMSTEVAQVWPGWSVDWRRDEYESQLLATEGKIQFPLRSTEFLQREIVSMLLQNYSLSPAKTDLGVAESAGKQGGEARVISGALTDALLEPGASERRRIVALALEGSFDNQVE